MKNFEKLWISVLRLCEKPLKGGLLLVVAIYRTLGTTHMGGVCRFSPSCSEYAVEAIRMHGFFSAVQLITKRVLKCRPGGSCGYDPVPCVGGDCHARSK